VALAVMHNPLHHHRVKQIDVGHHFIKERVLGGALKVESVETKDISAYMLPKALPKPCLEQHRAAIGLLTVDSETCLILNQEEC
jgi:hypothetical protein